MPMLQDRVALVIGAGATGDDIGNGRAIAIEYARQGALVVAMDRDSVAANRTAAIITAEGNACAPHAGDATDSQQVAAAVACAIATYGRLDILVNNVGIVLMGDPIELSEDDWDRSFAVNVKS